MRWSWCLIGIHEWKRCRTRHCACAKKCVRCGKVVEYYLDW
jgi:hypothetical protein